jgi:hypothetical protein
VNGRPRYEVVLRRRVEGGGHGQAREEEPNRHAHRHAKTSNRRRGGRNRPLGAQHFDGTAKAVVLDPTKH